MKVESTRPTPPRRPVILALRTSAVTPETSMLKITWPRAWPPYSWKVSAKKELCNLSSHPGSQDTVLAGTVFVGGVEAQRKPRPASGEPGGAQAYDRGNWRGRAAATTTSGRFGVVRRDCCSFLVLMLSCTGTHAALHRHCSVLAHHRWRTGTGLVLSWGVSGAPLGHRRSAVEVPPGRLGCAAGASLQRIWGATGVPLECCWVPLGCRRGAAGAPLRRLLAAWAPLRRRWSAAGVPLGRRWGAGVPLGRARRAPTVFPIVTTASTAQESSQRPVPLRSCTDPQVEPLIRSTIDRLQPHGAAPQGLRFSTPARLDARRRGGWQSRASSPSSCALMGASVPRNEGPHNFVPLTTPMGSELKVGTGKSDTRWTRFVRQELRAPPVLRAARMRRLRWRARAARACARAPNPAPMRVRAPRACARAGGRARARRACVRARCPPARPRARTHPPPDATRARNRW